MTKQEHARRAHLETVLTSHGFTPNEVDALRRISSTLHRWHELECGDCSGWVLEREGANGDGKPYMYRPDAAHPTRYPVADREAGARRRLAAIMETHSDVTAYIQGDPRGCALYLIPKDKLADGSDIDSVYSSRGIAVY